MNKPAIDIDSWGKKPTAGSVIGHTTKDASSEDSNTTSYVHERKPREAKTIPSGSVTSGHTTASKAPAREPAPIAITPRILGERIRASHMGISGEKSVKRFIFRNKTTSIAELEYILEIIKESMEEGSRWS